MITNKILRESKKRLKREMKAAKKRMKQCKKKYPDWRDDEYNMFENKFIFAVPMNDNDEPSFYTLNTLTCYFNRETRKYYLDFEFDKYECLKDATDNVAELARLGITLGQAYRAFREYIFSHKISLPKHNLYCVQNWLTEPIGESSSLAGLFRKFEFFVEYYLQEITREIENIDKEGI